MANSWVLNGVPVESPDGETILATARKAGVEVPSLCWSDSCGGQVRCMVCSVEDESSSRLLPACATIPQSGMRILTASPKVLSHRQTTLGWLLGEHRGDCLAPCHLACPAGLDVPMVLGSMAQGGVTMARAALASQLALSEVMGYLCDAPCEKVCHRGRVDESVAIRSFERLPIAMAECAPRPEKALRIVVVGGGVSGLASAEYLALGGVKVSILEAGDRLGGSLLAAVAAAKLPEKVLDRALSRLKSLGVESQVGQFIKTSELNSLQARFDAVVLATGAAPDAEDRSTPAQQTVEEPEAKDPQGMANRYVVGGALRGKRSLAAHIGDARRVAALILGQPLPIFTVRFSTSILPMARDEWPPLMNRLNPGGSVLPRLKIGEAPQSDDLASESERCLQCSCSALDSCSLRKQAIAEQVRPVRGGGRRQIGRRQDHSRLVFESGKCIACGLCVARCLDWPELPGLGWHGRGTRLTVQPPPGITLEEAVGEHCVELAQECPTGALMLMPARPRQP